MWVDDHGPVCSCGNVGCLEALFSGAALARDALAAARSETSPALAERLAANGTLTARDVADGAAEGDATCIRLIREGGRRVGTAEGRVTDSKGRLLVHGTTTCLIFDG